MAEEQIDPEIIRKLNAGMALTADEALNLARSAASATKNLDDFNKKIISGAKATAREILRLGMDASDASKGFDDLGAAMGTMARTIPFVGEALGGALQFLMSQVGQTAKAFTDLSQAGALSSRGMTGLREQFYRSGMSLQGFNKAVIDNANALSRFRGTVFEGTDDLGKVIGEIAYGPLGDQLRNLGISTDQIGEHTAHFIKQQTDLGLAQTKTNRQLSMGAAEYAKELDQLAKLTGQNRTELERQREAAMREGKYRAALMGMTEEEQKRLQNFNNMLTAEMPSMAKAMRGVAGGFVEGQDTIRGMNTSMGRLEEITGRVRRGMITEQQGLIELQQAVKGNIDPMRDLAAAVGDTDVFIPFAESADFVGRDLNGAFERIKNSTDDQIKGQDKYTQLVVESMRQMEMLSRSVSMMAFDITKMLVPAVHYLTDAMLGLVKVLSYIPGMPEAPTLPGRGPKTRSEAVKGEAIPAAVAGAGIGLGLAAAAAPFTGGASLAVYGGMAATGAVLFGARGAAKGAQKPLAGADIKAEDVLAFGSGSGSRSHFDQLDEGVKVALLQAASDYKSMTGQKLELNSARRSYDEQKRLYDEWIAGGRRGLPVAPPGSSRHETGSAIDIGNYTDGAAVAALNRQGFSQTVRGDPPHFELAQRYLGGPVSSNRAYLVGEQGPEIFTPGASGQITSNDNLQRALDSGLGKQTDLAARQVDLQNRMVSVLENQATLLTRILQAQQA